MFSLTLLDHLRLTFGQVIHRHRLHTQAAHSFAQWDRWLRGSEALLITGVAGTALAAAYGRGYVFAIVAAALASAALLVLVIRLTFSFETSAHVHNACSARLWQIREQYRSLLTDLHDGVIDADQARRRRDELMDELRAVYENVPPPALKVYQAARQSLSTAEEADFTDEELDLFLPKSLHKSEKGAPA
jgi:conflict system pore-forming effector with SLATT domain